MVPGVKIDFNRLRFLWCVVMHDSLTWPRNGWYQCRTCGRCYAVPWAEGRLTHRHVPQSGIG